jgi:DNA polymerase-1
LVIQCREKAKKLGWNTHSSVEADYWLALQLAKSDACETYGMADVVDTTYLWLFGQKKARELDRWESYEFEMRKLWPTIYRMEARGMHVFPDRLDSLIEECQSAAEDFRKKLAFLADSPSFNPGSTTQLCKLLFEKRGLQPAKFSPKTGNPSTAMESLEDYKSRPGENNGDEAVDHLIRYRESSKAISSFFRPFHEAKVPDRFADDGKPQYVIHTKIRQAGKRTGRLSATDPNLQGIPDPDSGRSDSQIDGRRPFGPRPGRLWMLADYSQLEVRTFAAASRYQKLIDILNEGRDLHTEATEGIWGGQDNERAVRAAMIALRTGDRREATEWLDGFDWEIVRAEASLDLKLSRNKGKPFFFTRMFGGGPKSIGAKLQISQMEARKLIKAYDKTLPGVIEFVREQGRQAMKTGYVTTLYGRKLDMPQGEEHKASPYIVQGTAADLVKRAMVSCEEYLLSEGIEGNGYGLILQIHDELIFELPWNGPEEQASTIQTVRILLRIMESQEDYIELATPVEAKFTTTSWADTTKNIKELVA